MQIKFGDVAFVTVPNVLRKYAPVKNQNSIQKCKFDLIWTHFRAAQSEHAFFRGFYGVPIRSKKYVVNIQFFDGGARVVAANQLS